MAAPRAAEAGRRLRRRNGGETGRGPGPPAGRGGRAAGLGRPGGERGRRCAGAAAARPVPQRHRTDQEPADGHVLTPAARHQDDGEGRLRVTRFEPTRAGIINMWDYRDEEFCFAGGWLVLRGPNGSGESTGRGGLVPFVLDGRIDPKRLNPFAAEDRTMKSNLLFRGGENAVGYVWLELRHRDTCQAVTIRAGLPAARHPDAPAPSHFTADGRTRAPLP